MFHSKSLILSTVISCIAAQSYSTNFGSSGSYSSFSLGTSAAGFGQPAKRQSYQQPAPRAYQQPAPSPAYQQPAPVRTYHQPAPAYHQPAQTYHQPAQTYHQPAQTYHQPAPPVAKSDSPHYGEKCTLDYTQESAEICVPSLKTNCEKEEVNNGLKLIEQEECFPVTRTVCTEDEEIVHTEVCAVAYRFQQVVTEAKLVDVKWEKECREEQYCPPSYKPPSYAPPQHQQCNYHTKKVCYQNPVVYPVTQPVTLKLPQPVDTCIVKDIALPRIKCTQVKEQRCNLMPQLVPGDRIEIDKCTTGLGEEICSETHIKLPRQACYEKVKKTVTVYEDVEPSEQVAYSG